MPAKINIPTGTGFGYLTTTGVREKRGRRSFVECACVCGKVVKVEISRLNSTAKSCGCLTAITHGLSYSSEHGAWNRMKQRCSNPKRREWKNYGGRGITVCPKWIDSFEAFYADMGPRPSAKHSIERVNNNLGYSKENCHWATRDEQNRNHRRNVNITFNGETHCITDWAKLLNIPLNTLYGRLHTKKWPIEKAFTTPVQTQFRNHRTF